MAEDEPAVSVRTLKIKHPSTGDVLRAVILVVSFIRSPIICPVLDDIVPAVMGGAAAVDNDQPATIPGIPRPKGTVTIIEEETGEELHVFESDYLRNDYYSKWN